MNSKKKSIISMLLAVIIMAITVVALPATKSSASEGFVRDKSKVALYFREYNYIYHATHQYTNYIRVPKEYRHKCYIELRYKLPTETEWNCTEANYYENLDDQYDIYKATCGIMGYEYECDIVCYGPNSAYYIDDNDGKHYSGNTLGVAPICALRTTSAVGYNNYTISALVKNLAYQKDVKVRYTTDNWKTYKEAPLSYVETNEDGNEYWSCDIDTTGATYDTFKYALCYKVNGQTYWDNNFNLDYDAYYHHNYL